jgi:ABC-type transport system involved in multi-copper enzyme maturation permease subunit
MLLLSLIAREFRETARKKRAHGLRLIFGGAMAVWFGMLVFRNLFVGAEAVGKAVYEAIIMPLNVGAFLLAPALSAPSIATERAEGTLGLLFLTKLRPFHIVVAKFVARLLELLSFLLFALPFLVLPIVLGGVSKDAVLLDVAGLLIMLIFGSAVGLFASAFCKSTTRAFLLALALLFILEYWWVFLMGGESGFSSPSEIVGTFVEYAPGFGLFNIGPWFPGDNPTRDDILLLALLNLAMVIVVAVILIALTSWKVARLAHPQSEERWVGWKSRLQRWNRLGNWVAATVGVIVIWFCSDLDLPVAHIPFYRLFEWGAILGWMTKLLLLVLVAHGLAEEKQARTLESVVCTPLPNASLVNRKIVDAWRWIWGWYLLFNAPFVAFYSPVLNWNPVPQTDPSLVMLGSLLLIVYSLLVTAIAALCSAFAKNARRAIVSSLVLWIGIALVVDQLCLDSGGWIPGSLAGLSFRLSGFLAWRVNPGNLTRGIVLSVALACLAVFLYLITVRYFRRFAARQ